MAAHATVRPNETLTHYVLHERGPARTQAERYCNATQELILLRRADRGPNAEAVAMLLMSQALSLRIVNVRHDAMPPHYLGALGSLRFLTHLKVRKLPGVQRPTN